MTRESGPPPNRVREARERLLMSQAELARRANVAPRTIQSVERGMNCQLATKRKILEALGMPFEERNYLFPPDASLRVRSRTE